jgi:hypothetical protein
VRKARQQGGEFQRWIHPTKGPKHWQFWLYLLLIPLRIAFIILWIIWDLVRGVLRQLSRVLMWILGTSRVQNAVDHLVANDFVNSINVRAAHLRRRARLGLRVTVMTARDRFPKWLDESSFLPPRAHSATRDDRITYFRRRIDWLKQVDTKRAVPRVTAYQLWQRELIHKAQLQQRRREEIWERRRKKQKRQGKERRRLRKIDYAIERKRCAAWRAWGKEKLKELAIVEKQRRKEEAIRQREEQRLQQLERQRLHQEQKLELERQRGLVRQDAQHGESAAMTFESQTDMADSVGEVTEGAAAGSELSQSQVESTVALCEPRQTGDGASDVEFPRNGHAEPSTAPVPAELTIAQSYDAADHNGSAEPAWKQSLNRKEKLRLEWPYLHTNGCGDFTMLAYEDWAALGGYAEFDMYSMHIDSLFLVAGALLGI